MNNAFALRTRTLSWTFGGLLLVALASCVTAVEVDFEKYPLGQLADPWSVTPAASGNTSTASIVSTPDHGKALLLHGGMISPDFLIASLPVDPKGSTIRVDVAIRPDEGASFIWSFNGTSGIGYSTAARRVRLMRNPGSTTLVASSGPTGDQACGILPSNVWSKVTLVLHTDKPDHAYDVQIDDAPTACKGVLTGLTSPYSGVNVMDASNEGWGGDVRFDDIRVTTQ